MYKKLFSAFLSLLFISYLQARQIVIPVNNTLHPRFAAGNTIAVIKQRIATEKWAADVYNQAKERIDPYVTKHQTDSTWIVSRLQMYWKTKSTDIFIKGGVFDHAEGTAPTATVKFPGTRDNVSIYTAPKLENIQPYMDDPRGVYLINKTKPGLPLEWAEISKTGRIIESINTQIMSMAYNAAVLYWISGEEKYAKFAFDLFDTYMSGMHYRKEPFDLNHGHHQTLAGLSTFEVIQEVGMLNNLTGIYDYLYEYLAKHGPAKMNVYSDVFKKWAELQINHGVAFNNWNLMEAKNTLNIALILDNDDTYADKKGNQYYTNYIVNTTSERQWSLQKIVQEGYDSTTGMWYECPGYSAGVLNDFIGYITFFDRYYNYDLLEQMPVLNKSVLSMAQYLFPNGYIASFGDSHYSRLNLNAANQLVANARKNNKPDQEALFTKYIKTIKLYYLQNGVEMDNTDGHGGARNITSLISPESNTVLNDKISAGAISEFVTPVLSAPNVSYFALRNGFDKNTGLMIAMSGSKGNHMHAGGISMEMYGKGYMLAPESGIGTSYFQPDYAEYYSQFPAHNTVAVDGVSAYPVMKSNHGFEVKCNYPASGQTKGFFSAVSFGDLYFLEPETNADQDRLTSIIRTSDSTAYYVDIFRSKRKNGKDKMHDYFYHNVGQSVVLNDDNGQSIDLQSTDKLSFSGGHLFAYDYLYDKKSIITDKNINAVFQLDIPGKETVLMNMWMKGEKGREIFAAKSPKSTAIDRMGLPKEIADLPLPTIVARQAGEAWTKPFSVIFEPSTTTSPTSLTNISSFEPGNGANDFIGLKAESKSGVTDYIFSTTSDSNALNYSDKTVKGSYAVISEQNNQLRYLFLGSGSLISKAGYSISLKNRKGAAALESNNGKWFFTSNQPATLTIPSKLLKGNTTLIIGNKKIVGKRIIINKQNVLAFEISAMAYSQII